MSDNETLRKPTWVEGAQRALALIREDLPADVARIEGQPLNGRVVAEAFGRMAAQVDALAHVLQTLLKEVTEP